MEYLNKILGIEVVYENVALTHLPNFIATRYRLQLVSMNGQRAIFLYPATELEQIEVLKKHIARIQKNENLPVILVLKECNATKVAINFHDESTILFNEFKSALIAEELLCTTIGFVLDQFNRESGTAAMLNR